MTVEKPEAGPQGYGYPSYGVQPQGLSLNLLTDVLRKRWALILVSAAIIAGIVIYDTARQSYFYQATTRVLFAAQDNSSAINTQGTGPRSSYTVPSSVLSTQEAVIRSDAVMERVVQALNLADREKEPQKFEGEVRRLKGMVQVTRAEDSTIFQITATSGVPEQAMLIANSVSEAYIKYNYDKTLSMYRKSVSWLSDELVDLEKKLEEAQHELITFIEREKLTNFGDETSPVAPRAPADNEESLLKTLNTERANLELQLSQLLKRYRPAHPKVRKVQDDLAAVKQKLTEEGRLSKLSMDERTKEIIGSKQKEIKYSILTRKVDINKQLYNTLIKKLKETDIDSAVIHNNVDILEYAKTPGSPAGPNKRQRILFGVVFGIVFSCGLAMLLEFMDTTVRTVEDVQAHLKFPVLASIPKIEKENSQNETPVLSELRPESPLREAYRTLRTNIRFSASSGHGRIIMVTSCEKGEGKSTIAANIGIINAESGKKTLLIDADFRVHSLTTVLGVSNERGLTDCLTENEPSEKFIIPSGRDHLWVIPAGPTPPKPAVLLESDRMRALTQELREKYDQIIIDVPPVALVIDPVLVSHFTDGVVLVVEAGRVSRLNISRTIEQLVRVNANIFGVVLNKEERGSKGYYAYRGYYSYGETKA